MKQKTNSGGVIDEEKGTTGIRLMRLKNTVILNSNGSHCNDVFYVREQRSRRGREGRGGGGKPKQSSLILPTEKTLRMNTLKPSFYIKFPT